MRGDEVIENGTVVIEGNRIAAVGPAGSVAVPAGAQTIDMAGKTILPGFFDAHWHGPHALGRRRPATRTGSITTASPTA